jgi:hypothetical protein
MSTSRRLGLIFVLYLSCLPALDLGGNFLIVHVLMDAKRAYYPSKIARNDVAAGSPASPPTRRAAEPIGVVIVPLGFKRAGAWTDLVSGTRKPGRASDGVPARGYVRWEYRSQ